MEKMIVSKNHNLLPAARELRRNMTREERHLWYDFLKPYPVKIYRQRIINNFIADFYCHKARLVVELDGSQHYTEEGLAYDAERTAVLAQYGIAVLRFSNLDVNRNFAGVCLMIDRTIRERMGESLHK
ncbi:MAG: endonuclease domain-containing protein [Oscillospiraceae bacterium]|nr:endonuclease domain-containing protein [Oscillibacter sp.]MBQ3548256.1 endonuclease domain-containing protein [Oscillospiraceae bacterium]